MIIKFSTLSQTRLTWYLDLCTSQHFTNNQSLFVSNIQPKTCNFTTAGGQIIRSEGVGIVCIDLANGASIKVEDVALASECNSNLI